MNREQSKVVIRHRTAISVTAIVLFLSFRLFLRVSLLRQIQSLHYYGASSLGREHPAKKDGMLELCFNDEVVNLER